MMAISPRLLLVIRVFVGLVFSVYGVVKILGGQLYYGDWTMTRATVDAPGKVHLVRSRYTGLYGFNRRAEVLLAGDGKGADTILVTAHRASGFTPWRIDSIDRRPAPNALLLRR